MKLLVSWMRELGTYVSREFHYTMQDLVRVHGWRHVEPWVLSQRAASGKAGLVEFLGEVPEVVLFWDRPPHAASQLARALRKELAQLQAEDFIARWSTVEH